MEDQVENSPVKNRIVAASLALSGFLLGYYGPIMNSMAGPILDGRYHLQGADRVSVLGNLNFYFAIGAMLGVLFTSKLMDTLGRRRLNMLLDLTSILFISLMAIENLFFLQLTRLLVGYNASAYVMVSGITMVETLPQKVASQGNMLVYIVITSTLLLTFIQQSIFGYETMTHNWRTFLCYPMIFSIARFCLLFHYMTFDSPKYITLRYSDHPDYENILKDNLREVFSGEYIDERYQQITAEASKSQENKQSGFLSLLSLSQRKAFISVLFIQVVQQLSGVNFFVYFSTEFFNNLSGNGKAASFFLGLGNLLGGILATFLVNRFKRITLLKGGILLQGGFFFLILTLALLKVYFPLPFMVLLYMLSYAVGLGATMGLYVNEIATPAGVGISTAANWLTASIIGKFSPIGVELLGSFGMIAVFGFLCVGLYFAIPIICIDNQATTETTFRESVNKFLLQPLTEIKEQIVSHEATR